MKEESYEQFLTGFIDANYAASALWLWDFPLVPARDCFKGCP